MISVNPSLTFLFTMLVLHNGLALECHPTTALAEEPQEDNVGVRINEVTGEFFEYKDENTLEKKNELQWSWADPDQKEMWYFKAKMTVSEVKALAKGLPNAQRLTEEQSSPDQAPFSTQLIYSACFFDADKQDEFIVMLGFNGGVQNVEKMLVKDTVFGHWMKDPRNRMKFYAQVVGLQKRLAQVLKLRICVFEPSRIGVVEVGDRDEGDQVYYPILTDILHAVNLGEGCVTQTPMFSPSSVFFNNIETTEMYQKRIEVYSAGVSIMYIEGVYLHEVVEGHQSLDQLPEWFEKLNPTSDFVDFIKENDNSISFDMEKVVLVSFMMEAMYRFDKKTTKATYKADNFKKNFEIVRASYLETLSEHPWVGEGFQITYKGSMNMSNTGDANAYFQTLYLEFFDCLRMMTNENNIGMSGRYTADEAMAALNGVSSKMSGVFEQVEESSWLAMEWRRNLLLI